MKNGATEMNSDAGEVGDSGLLVERVRGLKRWLRARLVAHQLRTTALRVHRRNRF